MYFSNIELQQIVTNCNSHIPISFLKHIPNAATSGKVPANNSPCLLIPTFSPLLFKVGIFYDGSHSVNFGV